MTIKLSEGDRYQQQYNGKYSGDTEGMGSNPKPTP